MPLDVGVNMVAGVMLGSVQSIAPTFTPVAAPPDP
jgi:hypothetical protein